MRIFVIRHGQTTANIGQANGELESNIPLTEKGIEQCKKAGQELKKYCDENNVDLAQATVYYSPYLRTQHTGEYVCKEIGATIFKPEQRLTERDFGKFATHEYAYWNQIDSAENARYLQSLSSPYSAFYHRLPNGEAVHDCYLRVEPFTNKLKDMAEKEKVGKENILVIITHRISGKCFLMNMLEETVLWYSKTKDLPNCCLMQIDNHTPDQSFQFNFLDGYQLLEKSI